jgi:hypothetical protein
LHKQLTGTWFLALLLLAACSSATSQHVNPTGTPSISPEPTITLTQTPTALRTPPALPGTFQTSLLNPLDTPHTYVADTCQSLRDQWTSTNAAPGTVVMVIMFHSVTGDPVAAANQISETDFRQLMESLHENGFTAITSEQLANFMESNAAIPQRSVLLTADDRHQREYFDKLFRQYWEAWGWPGWTRSDVLGRDGSAQYRGLGGLPGPRRDPQFSDGTGFQR